jgi:tRNA synthetase class II (D, K and N)
VMRTINLQRPWRRARYHDLIREVAGQDWFDLTSEQRRERASRDLGVEILPQLADFEVTQHVFEKLVEEKTFDPLFVTHCPKELVPLAKQNVADPSLVDVYELIINGVEISPGYTELNNPDIQRQRLLEQAGEETQKIDEEFLLALEHGMPPAGGVRDGNGSFDHDAHWRGIHPRRHSVPSASAKTGVSLPRRRVVAFAAEARFRAGSPIARRTSPLVGRWPASAFL